MASDGVHIYNAVEILKNVDISAKFACVERGN